MLRRHLAGLKTGVQAIACGKYFTCAIDAIGALKCWGNNHAGQIGDGTIKGGVGKPSPVQVSGLIAGVQFVEAGDHFTCAIDAMGAAKCWGQGGSGQIGNGATVIELKPTQVYGLTKGVLAVAAGSAHACAITSDGAVKCWGQNDQGQLGNGSSGSSANQSKPVQAIGLTNGVVGLAAGDDHTCALLASGQVMCWGSNYKGQLGNGAAGSGLVGTIPKPAKGLAP